MQNLNVYAKEFVAIASYLIEKKPENVAKTYVYVKQDELLRLLNKNQFATAQQKLQIWRDLRWIDCEPGRFTKRLWRGKKTHRMVILELSVHARLTQFVS